MNKPLRIVISLVAMVITGFLAYGCWVGGLISGLGTSSVAAKPLWFLAAGLFFVAGAVIWAVLVPWRRYLGIILNIVISGVWFVVLGGLSILGFDL